MAGEFDSGSFDLIWPVGFGPRHTYLDRLHLLALMDQRRLITPALTQLTYHGKAAWLQYAPPSIVSKDPGRLEAWFAHQDARCVLKPLAGSYGDGVALIERAEQLRRMATDDQYWILQRFIEKIEDGETRTLIAAGKVIGSYLRQPAAGEFRSNLARHATPVGTVIDTNAQHCVDQVRKVLIENHIHFASVDTCDGYVIEVNVVNPGGLATLESLYARQFTGDVVDAVSARLMSSRPWQESDL